MKDLREHAEKTKEAIKFFNKAGRLCDSETEPQIQILINVAKQFISLAESIENVKGLPTVEDLVRIICDKELTPDVAEDSGQAEWSMGEARKLATAIHEQYKLALAKMLSKEKLEEIVAGYGVCLLGVKDVKRIADAIRKEVGL